MRTIYCEIRLDALRHNYHLLAERAAPSRLMAVVKANAYGHGDVRVAICLHQAGCRDFAVARVHEGVRLREAGITGAILVLGGAWPREFDQLVENALTPVVYCWETVEEIVRSGLSGISVQIKVDTGMNRLGFRYEDVPRALAALTSAGVRIEGVLSHLACAEEVGTPVTPEQERRFRDLLAQLDLGDCATHLANSAGIFTLNGKYSLSRAGILLYGGVLPCTGDLPLRPVMHFKSKILQVRRLEAGEGISYGHSFVADEPMHMAVVSGGYADGYPRVLSNRAHALVQGVRVPVVGTVCMDMLMLDVTGLRVQRGDEVVLFGEQLGTALAAAELAQICGTIDYELFCGISQRVERVYTDADA